MLPTRAPPLDSYSWQVLIPKVAGRIGSNATLSVGALGVCVIFTIQCIPWVQEHVAPLIAVWVVYKVFFLFVMITNQSKSRAIAAGYAINAGGQVTGIGRVFFALGQGVGPVVSAGLYEIHPSCAYAGLLGLFVANLIFAAVMGFPFFKDVEIKAAEGSPADKLKKEYETAIASSTAAASTTAITTSSAAANESSTAGQSVATPAEPTAAK